MNGPIVLSDYASQQNDENSKILSKVGTTKVKQHRLDFTGQRVLTIQQAFIDLRNKKNGAHMSRLMEAMRDRKMEQLQMDDDLLQELKQSHADCGTRTSYWTCKWESEHMMENDQELFVVTELAGSLTKSPTWFLTTWVPYTSVCPCSADMVHQAGHGYPHMQRATAKITGILHPESDLDEILTATVATVINVVGLVPQPFMKREHELAWCKSAATKPLFVEDAARVLANAMDAHYKDYTVECTHEESIHQHDVFAMHRKGEKLL